jgi:hypothetical protein
MQEIDIDDLTPSQKLEMEKYCQENCTSDCGRNQDCPHEEQYIEMLNEALRMIVKND